LPATQKINLTEVNAAKKEELFAAEQASLLKDESIDRTLIVNTMDKSNLFENSREVKKQVTQNNDLRDSSPVEADAFIS